MYNIVVLKLNDPKHFLYIGAGVVTLSLGFTFLWNKIFITGPTEIAKNYCAGPYNISLVDSKNFAANISQDTVLDIKAKTPDGSDNNLNFSFYSDNNCLNQITTLTLPKPVVNGQFYIKYNYNNEIDAPINSQITLEASKFWAGSILLTVLKDETNPPPSSNTKIGVHVVIEGNASQEVDLIKRLGAIYSRLNIILDLWPYTPNQYNTYIDQGVKVLLNVTWKSTAGSPVPFPTGQDLSTYADKLDQLLNYLTISNRLPELVTIENEEINPSFHSGPLDDYATLLQTASPIVHSYGLKLTNGGIYGDPLDTMTYRYLKNKYGQTFAENNFGNYVFLAGSLRNANEVGRSPVLETKIADIQTVLNAASYLDYINVHHYEPDNPNILDPSTETQATTNALKFIKEFVETTTGKPMIVNETSTRANNTMPELITSILEDYVNNNIPYVIWWDNEDGNGFGGVPLNDNQEPPFALRPNGEAFRDFLMSLE